MLYACERPSTFRDLVRRCGKCPPCLALRRYDWVVRCRYEACQAERVWFVTLTCRRVADGSAKLDYKDLQKWLKRVRKGEDKLRFICAREGGKDNPHFHLLVFCKNTLTQRDLRSHWKLGISQAKLAGDTPSLGRYITKQANYLMKDRERIRCSQKFGDLRSFPLLDQVLATFPGARVVGFRGLPGLPKAAWVRDKRRAQADWENDIRAHVAEYRKLYDDVPFLRVPIKRKEKKETSSVSLFSLGAFGGSGTSADPREGGDQDAPNSATSGFED